MKAVSFALGIILAIFTLFIGMGVFMAVIMGLSQGITPGGVIVAMLISAIPLACAYGAYVAIADAFSE